MEIEAPRGLPWRAGQTSLSAAIGLAGALGLAVAVGGTFILVASGGVTPYGSLVKTIKSDAQAVVLITAIVLGVVAAAAGFGMYKRMPSKRARETAIGGAVLGIQAILFSVVYLWFRSGDVEIFARNFFNFEGLSEFWGQFLVGARNTVFLALFGQGLGMTIGLVMSLMILSKRKVVRTPARAYINFFRGTPLLWQLSFGFFGFVLGLRLELSAYQIAILVLALNAGAYTAEIFRAGIQSIERGQMEASRSLGMSYLQSMRYVMLPQAFRRVIPPMTNEFVILIKDTSLVSILGLAEHERELLKVGRDIYKTTFNATPLLATALGYLAVTIPLMRFVSWLERRLRSGLTGPVGR